MRRAGLAIPIGAGALLLALSAFAGPILGVGAVIGAGAVAIVAAVPALGLGMMILTGTALQVPGSEHLTGLPLSLGKIAGVTTFAAWLVRSALSPRRRLTYSPQMLALLGYFLWMAVGVAMASDRGLALDGLFRYAQLFLLFFMLASFAGEQRRVLDLTCVAVLLSLGLSSVIGMLEFFLPSLALESEDPSLAMGALGAILDRDSIEGVVIKRITGGLSDSNWFAYTLVCLLPINLYLFHRARGILARLFVLTTTALEALGIILSYTRSALIAGVVVVVVLAARKRLPLRPLLAAGLLAGVVLLIWNPPGLERVFSPSYAAAGSTPIRETALRGGIALIKERPLLGYGYGQFGEQFFGWLKSQTLEEGVEAWAHDIQKRIDDGEDDYQNVMPHNTLVLLWVEYGLPGVVACAGLFWLILRDLSLACRLGSPSYRLLADCLVAGTLSFLVCASFGNLMQLKVVWIIGGLAAALRRLAIEDAALRRLAIEDAAPATAGLR